MEKITIDLYVSDKKVKQFNKTGSCEIMREGYIYRFMKKPADLKIERQIEKYKNKIKILKEKAAKAAQAG